LFFLTPQLRGQAAEKTTVGVGFELNTISLVGVAGGLILYSGYNLSPRFVLGFKIGVNSDLTQMNSLEGTAFFRWYYYTRGTLDSADYSSPPPRTAFFVQAGAGAGVYGGFLDNPRALLIRTMVLGEAAAGLRVYFRQGGSPIFFEPFVRYAYPSGFGAGFTFGG
jgi:hypothetical protein